jgi:transcriptional antiterminator NusG
MKKWYIVQTYSSFEKKVSKTLEENIKKMKLEESFEKILIPTHDVTEVKRGKRVQSKKKYFPGYVLVKMEMSKDMYHMIKGIQKVSGFLGKIGEPTAVSENDVHKIMSQIEDGVVQPKSGPAFDIGEKVQVIDGPFASFSGLVEGVDEEKHRLKVAVSIFGRPTPVDLEYNQVEKV